LNPNEVTMSISIIPVVAIVAAGLGAGAAGAAERAPYPARPIRFVVPFPAGGGADILARAIGQKMGESLEQQIVIDNRPGAAGVIGTDIAAKAAPDGYTMLMLSSNLAILEGAGGQRPYNLTKDLRAVSMIAVAPNILVVHPSVPVKSVPELVAYAKAQAGKLHFASNGVGSSSHLSAELFKSMAGVNMVHVPYKGGPPGVTATIAGETQLMFSAILHVLPHAKAGRVRALGVTSRTRSQAAPQVPTIAESGLSGYESIQWWLMMVPATTPAAITGRVHGALTGALSAADLRERLSSQGAEPLTGTPDEGTRYLLTEIAKWGKIVRTAGIKLD
jgi:tripartite-type tricarboxylate transporter receptor subunit TctC